MNKHRDPFQLFVGKPHNQAVLPKQEHYTPDRPDSEDKVPDQDPYNSQLTNPLPTHDMRLAQYKQREKVLKPTYNVLYGNTSVEGAWRYEILATVTGNTGTTSANATITKSITLSAPLGARLVQWPGAIHGYLVLRYFSLAPQAAITTVGSINVTFLDAIGGYTVPLGNMVSSGSMQQDRDVIIPTPITDPNITTLGSLLVNLVGAAPTTSDYNFQLGFSVAYLLPSLHGYDQESIHEVLGNVASTHH